MSTKFSFDVFLSYSSHDRPLVRQIAERLRDSGFKVWFDQWEIRPGDHILQKLEEGLELSRVLVLCMSEHAFGSDWTQLESGTFRFRDPLNRERRLIPLRLDDCAVKGSLKQLAYLDWRRHDGSEAYPELLEACRASQPLVSKAEDETRSPRRTNNLDQVVETGGASGKLAPTPRSRGTSADRINTVIGSYKLIATVRHDGLGPTYVAERVDRQYSAFVEIKVFEGAATDPDIVGLRFRADRLFLASLNHHLIARVLDMGETENAEPYLVTERVDGEPIDQHCDGLQLSLEERLVLFLKICDAVQYVHRNLIVCRNLAPTNILVTREGDPKLLNVGIARLLDPIETEPLLGVTQVHDGMLAAKYASPEQILGRPITTASDIYSLGVLLYELLTGVPPYPVSPASQLELERSICVTEPERPSVIVRRTSSAIEGDTESPRARVDTLARARATTPKGLTSDVPGDLRPS